LVPCKDCSTHRPSVALRAPMGTGYLPKRHMWIIQYTDNCILF